MTKSKLTRAMTSDGGARLIFAETTAVVQRAHEIHKTSKTMTAALGRCLTATSMMGCMLKDKTDTLSLQIKGDGPAGGIVCISNYAGDVRGYAANPDAELPPNEKGKLNVGGAVGAGTLTVVRSHSSGEPYIGVCDLVNGEIAEDITKYFAVSEQTPTVCALGVMANRDNSCKAAGGFLLQLLPGADEAIIPTLEVNVTALEPVSTMINNGESANDIIAKIFKGVEYSLFDEIEIEYKCPCSRESYIRGLMSLGEKELEKLIDEDKPVETRCRYCGAEHTFTLDEIRNMLTALKEAKAAAPETSDAPETPDIPNTPDAPDTSK